MSLTAIGQPRRILFYIDIYKQHALFRRGFSFMVENPDGKSHRFSEAELDESKPHAHRRRSLSDIAKSRYGLDSFPPTYRPRVDPRGADNIFILKWWTPDHDELLKLLIARDAAAWWPSRRALCGLVNYSALLQWKREDPLCRTRNWAEVLEEFARSRAGQIGLEADIDYPAACWVCARKYDPKLIGPALRKRLDVQAKKICDYCLAEAFLHRGDQQASPDKVLHFFRSIASAIQRIPSTNILTDSDEVVSLPPSQLVDAIKALQDKPSRERVNEVFGSWLQALVEADLLDGPARRTSRGIQCIAVDGHLCKSLGEKTVDDFLHEHGIPHEREVPYAGGRFRCDFVANGVLIEYFGLIGDPAYDERHQAKLQFCLNGGFQIVCLYPEDLVDRDRMQNKLAVVRGAAKS
jgi:hypothetical protein